MERPFPPLGKTDFNDCKVGATPGGLQLDFGAASSDVLTCAIQGRQDQLLVSLEVRYQ